jgi:hypothetical protein
VHQELDMEEKRLADTARTSAKVEEFLGTFAGDAKAQTRQA